MNDAELKTQAEAERRHGGELSLPLFFVNLPHMPPVTLRAADEAEAIQRYDALCGIVSPGVWKHRVTQVEGPACV